MTGMRRLARWVVCATWLAALAGWSPVRAQDAAAEDGQIEYQVKGWGQSDPVDLFHFIFQWLDSTGAVDYDDQYLQSEWVFASSFDARADGCQSVAYAPDTSQDPIDMIVCDHSEGADVTGEFHLTRKLINQRPFAYDPARPFAFPVIDGPPYVSWALESNSFIAEFAVSGNMAAVRAAPSKTSSRWTGTLFLIQDRGEVPEQRTMGSVENVLSWQGDRRSYIAPVADWSSEGVSSIEELLYAGLTGQLEEWPENNKHLKAWPMGGVSIEVLDPSRATAISEGHVATRPATIALEQNYPNPFNSGTVIRFSLPEAAHVELAIYNVSGQRVVTLIGGLRAAGVHTIHWDGRGDSGQILATGSYVFRLHAADQVLSRRLVVLR
jgi:hypothetical protein